MSAAEQPDLTGKTAIVTGGARGIGAAYARGLAAAGASVLVADLRDDDGEHTAKSITADGGTARYLSVDVTDPDATERMCATAADAWGGVDILVNNAAMFATLEAVSMLDLPPDRWDRVMAVNIKGVWLCTRAVVPHMRARGGGVIVNQASVGAFGLQGFGRVDYGTSKAAVIGFTKNAAKELGSDNIRVNAICPGGVTSEAALSLAGGDVSLIQQAASQTQLIPEAITPDDMVSPLLFLAGDASKFMTGQSIVVDGGRHFLG